MKKVSVTVSGLLARAIFAAAIILGLTLVSCSNSSNDPADTAPVTRWKISGTIDYDGAPTYSVKLAGFLLQGGGDFSENAVIVTNVVNLGTAVNAAFPFVLTFKLEDADYTFGDIITIVLWQESIDDNGLYDYVDKTTSEPMAMALTASGCAVFETAIHCDIYYFDYDDPDNNILEGWNIHNGPLVSFKPIEITTNSLSGALLDDPVPNPWL
jgi:hypothetical protein